MPSHFKNARDVSIEGSTIISANTYNSYGERPPKTAIEKLREHVAAGALHNSAERCDAPKCHPETRVAVQDEVVSWIRDGDADEEPKKIMWVTGPAGAGKTAIIGSVAATCQGKGILGAAHFFSALSASANRRSKRYLVPTLAYQLAQHKAMANVAEEIFSAVERNPLVFEQTLEAQLDQLILEPLRACRDHPQVEWPRAILIDGLDECEADQYHDSARSKAPLRSSEDDQTEILSVLKRATDDPDFPFRVVIASRPEHAIKHFFNDFEKPVARELFLNEKYNPGADMELYLESEFARIRRQHRHLPPSWPSKDVRETLIANASGQFIYVATVARFMKGTGDPRLLLDQVLQLPGIKASTIASPFAILDALYAHILSRGSGSHLRIIWLNLLFREEYLNKSSNVGLSELWSQSAPKDQPSAAVARVFLESYPGEALDVFRNLNSLLYFPLMEDRASFSLYHKSLVDFLVEPARSGKLYVNGRVVLNFFVQRYWSVGRAEADSLVSEIDREEFLQLYFLPAMIGRAFSSNSFRLVSRVHVNATNKPSTISTKHAAATVHALSSAGISGARS
ncbi:hypothetical protein MD484_g6780, partial [Candolleomyces efflorescens]